MSPDSLIGHCDSEVIFKSTILKYIRYIWMMCIQEHNIFRWRVKCSRSTGGLNKKSCYWAKKTNKKTPQNNQIKANDTFSKSRPGVCQPDGILISLDHLAASRTPLSPSFCLNGHADSDMIFSIKGAKRSMTGCKTSISVIGSCVAPRPWQHRPLSISPPFLELKLCTKGVMRFLCIRAQSSCWGVLLWVWPQFNDF